MNRINKLFEQKNKSVLSIYFTAGYPALNDTLDIAEALEKAGADFLEIGIPYSDPLADGPVIQNSSLTSISNGMTIKVLLEQLKDLRKRVSIPVFLMGYFNPVLQYGVERFCEACSEVGVDGMIIPDLPMYEYEELYQDCFKKHNLSNVFLITPQTSDERIRHIDELTNGFIYLLSSASTTGKNLDLSLKTDEYFSRIKNMNLKNPAIVGFGISDHASFSKASEYAHGAIVGTAFVKLLATENYQEKIPAFIQSLKNPA
ncbi:tryptophan synthase alpha chain [Arcticibacter pallidicorallinus]|uniref:Tryptophan synthase alpha chain n=1 Tax=Arcticibacter pallidicorallinus TaxID=1259464 RepID=A0A2T0TYW6_9SPHI|nr:tryptophan synthase subunit alpha [Arcticibacter pallidicorallinus]PRY50886.1 tryptophan synthase alpha chain [Arcticibacter pallidicorallinus]